MAVSNLCSAFVGCQRLGRVCQLGARSLEGLVAVVRSLTMARWKVELELQHLDMVLECLDIGMGRKAGIQRILLSEVSRDSLRLQLVLVLDSWCRWLELMVGSLMGLKGMGR